MQSDIVESQMAKTTSTISDKSNGKVPKRIHKSQREKKKREHLNELFLALANSLELSEQSTCKASVLIEATQLLKDTLTQIKCLKELNSALLSESEYILGETNELKDENSSLEAEIEKLQTEIKSMVSDMQLDLNEVPPENRALDGTNGPLELPQHFGQLVNPLNFSGFCSNVQAYPGFTTEQQLPSGNICAVSKPHARYPSPADAWPSQILEKQPKQGNGGRDGYRNNTCCAEVWP